MNCPFGALAELSAGAILVVRPTGTVAYGNPASARLLGANPAGQSLLDWASESVRPSLCGFLGSLENRESASSTAFTTCELRHADGRMVWVQIQGVNAIGVESVDGLILTLFDISSYKQRESELLHAVSRDAVTGLPNRRYFTDRLHQVLSADGSCTLALGDLDQFKQVNDTYGHHFGDKLLRAVADRLLMSLPADATVARLGGDEFALLMAGPTTPAIFEAIQLAWRSVTKPYAIDGITVQVGMSVGVTTARPDQPKAAYSESDLAMYAAKIRGRNQVVWYGVETREEVESQREQALNLDLLREANRKLHEESRRDALTGLPNRRALSEVEETRIGQPGSLWSACSVLFADVDYFGNYNKAYGDNAGDVALKALADCLKTTARETDLVFRKGGEEFVIVLPNADLRTSAAIADRIRLAVLALGLAHARGGPERVLTMSIAVMTAAGGDTVGQTVVLAGDLAMEAKRANRRNAVTLPGFDGSESDVPEVRSYRTAFEQSDS